MLNESPDYLRRDLLPRLRASKRVDPERIEDILRYAAGKVPVRMRPGNVGGGFGVTERDIADFMRDVENAHPGWLLPEHRAAVEPQSATEKPSANATSWSESEFRNLPPGERIRLANRGTFRDDNGRVYVRDDKSAK